LNWLPRHDGTVTNEWRDILRDKPPSKVRDKAPSIGSLMRDKAPSIGPKSLRADCPSLYRSSYHGGGNSKVEEGEGSREPVRGESVEVRLEGQGYPAGKPEQPAARCPWYVTGPTGHRICGKPAVPGNEHCTEHVCIRGVADSHAP
jgi:hypothetical protein